MAVAFEFARDGHVLVATYAHRLEQGDLASVFDALMSACEQASTPVHNIADFTQLVAFPPNVLSLARSHYQQLRHPMLGAFVVVSPNRFFETMLNSIVRIMPHLKLKVVRTIEQAWVEIDHTLEREASPQH